MGKAVSLFCRSRGAIVGANLMKHQSGKETVRSDELGTCGVGCLARLLPYRNVRVPGIPPQWFLYPATNRFATAGGLGLQSGVDAKEVLRMNVRKTLRSLRRQRQLPLPGNPPTRRRRCKPRYGRLSHVLGPCQGRVRADPAV